MAPLFQLFYSLHVVLSHYCCSSQPRVVNVNSAGLALSLFLTGRVPTRPTVFRTHSVSERCVINALVFPAQPTKVGPTTIYLCAWFCSVDSLCWVRGGIMELSFPSGVLFRTGWNV